ncbi:MAG: hypothetical protein CBC65_000400 [Rhodothermaceae bacterium TMED105]|jgi:mannose-6-phosphate isomerase-like protein (cupin superfamily)|nr:MAG: hypothetical protein CBC65_000400 [Rhodothermaceae bacterium TMED105]|tara:strand:- start:1631 stop:2359 length:729 start_codon:yes stop_codon:yes gene_type:complete
MNTATITIIIIVLLFIVTTQHNKKLIIPLEHTSVWAIHDPILNKVSFDYVKKNMSNYTTHVNIMTEKYGSDQIEHAGQRYEELTIGEFITQKDPRKYVKWVDEDHGLKTSLKWVKSRLIRILGRPRGKTNWSFWLGFKGSFTSLHYDEEVTNLLYVIHGLKRITLVSPKDASILPKSSEHCSDDYIETKGACWFDIDIFNAAHVPRKTILVRSGECIQIPSGYAHAAENLEDTIAVSLTSDA